MLAPLPLLRLVRVSAIAYLLVPMIAAGTPPRASTHPRVRHRAGSTSSSSSPTPSAAPTASSASPSPSPTSLSPDVRDIPPERLVRFEVLGDEMAPMQQFASQIRTVLAGMPDITMLAPGPDAFGPSSRPLATGPAGHAMDATTHGWRVGTAANGDHRTDVVVRPPRPRLDNDPMRDMAADYATGALSLNVAVELSDRNVAVAPVRGAPRTDRRHTIEFVLAATGRALFPRTDVRARVERLAVPRGCEIVWR